MPCPIDTSRAPGAVARLRRSYSRQGKYPERMRIGRPAVKASVWLWPENPKTQRGLLSAHWAASRPAAAHLPNHPHFCVMVASPGRGPGLTSRAQRWAAGIGLIWLSLIPIQAGLRAVRALGAAPLDAPGQSCTLSATGTRSCYRVNGRPRVRFQLTPPGPAASQPGYARCEQCPPNKNRARRGLN